jgi:hypothetical protein
MPRIDTNHLGEASANGFVDKGYPIFARSPRLFILLS